MAQTIARTDGSQGLEGLYPWMAGRPEDRRLLRAAVLLAVATHLWLFVVHWPDIGAKREPVIEKPPILVYRIQQPRFIEERPRQDIRPPAREVPIPDPDPDDPEILRPEPEPVPELPLDDQWVSAEVPPPPPVEEAAPTMVEVGQVSPPRVIERVEPRYPRAALVARLSGDVVLDLVVAEDGSVEDVEVLEAIRQDFADSAKEAVWGWKFEPSTYQGRPVKVHYVLTVRFRLR